ncbi:MAG: hypothetical protein NZ895_04775 [Archaeoglobaceae archaeon]|nr:hypothetical protein [Archaeoglobaceae archaeon]MCX8152652.1 hypothetical protein [Archaeoglobaceae archaeon]MDW8014066.1 hypothetical protein [Archaeoglobaceae archaeon]
MIFTVIFSSLLTKGYSLRLLRILSPLLIFFAISLPFYPEVWKLALLFISIISAGSLIFASTTSQISAALLYFKVPEKFVSVVNLSLNFLQLLLWDLENIKEVQRSRIEIIKVLTSLSILRALGLAETLYSKCYSYKTIFYTKKPGFRDLLIFATVLLIVIVSIILN